MGMIGRARLRTYEILDAAKPGDRASAVFDTFIMTLIVANVVVLIIETVESARIAAPDFFKWFDDISVTIFTIEYVLRIWSCTADPTHRRPVVGRIHFGLRPLPLIDLLAILPYYLPGLGGIDLRTLRVFRLFRLARIFRFERYAIALSIILTVLKDRRAELGTAFAFLLSIHLLASIAMYYAERGDPDTQIHSIPEAMWWSVITLTTVGYGDITPVTILGKVFGGIIAVLGIAMFALPTAILGGAFVEEFEHRRGKRVFNWEQEPKSVDRDELEKTKSDWASDQSDETFPPRPPSET